VTARRDVALIASQLDNAIVHRNRAWAGEKTGTPVYRSTPGCTRYCAACDIRCAVLTGAVHDLERELEAALAVSTAPTFYVSEGGRC
jgi:hypothetical protein